MVTMIVIDWNRGTNYGCHHWYQRTTGKITIGHGYIYTPCILDYDKHICIYMEVGNSALDMKQSFISWCFSSCCSRLPTLLTMMVFTNSIKPIVVLTLSQYLRLWRICSSGGTFHNPNFCVWFHYNDKYIDTLPLDFIYSFINQFLLEEWYFLT